MNKAARKWYLAALGDEWPYLSTNEAKSRCVIAAHYLKECDNLVEIGGYLTPIHEFLSPAGQEIWVFDPKLPEKDFSLGMAPAIQVRQRPLRFQAAKMSFKAGSYGLVLLGCSLKFDKKDPADKIEGFLPMSRNSATASSRFGFEGDSLLSVAWIRVKELP